MSYTRNCRNTGTGNKVATPFCKVCYDAGLPTEQFTSHFVKDQPGPNGKVVCPTLLAQKCLICGIPGHTSSYCPDNSSVSSCLTLQKKSHFTPALATDEIRYPPHSIRLPPMQFQSRDHERRDYQQKQNTRPIPRIVYPTPTKPKNEKNEFPSLHSLSSLRRFENDEPTLKRSSQASPLHSPLSPQSPRKLTNIQYNKKNNPFGDLGNSDNESESEFPPIAPNAVTKKSEKQQLSSWSSIAAGNKVATTRQQGSTQQQHTRSRFSIVLPSAISAGPLLPPLSFKPKPVSTSEVEKKQVKKLWGDTDSEDDEEFLSRGLVKCGYKTRTLPEP
jgi:hypothetical protein